MSTQDKTKLLQQLKSGFKRTIIWNKYQSKVSAHEQNQYLDYLIDLSSQGMNRVFILSFENITNRTAHTGYKKGKEIQKISFTGNLGREGNKTMFFILEKVKETILDISERIVKVS